MEVRLSTSAAPDRRANEDGMLAIGDLVAVFDGVTQPATVDSGCVHGPAWYVGRLSTQLALSYASNPADALPNLLAAAIAGVTDEHRATCDLSRPTTPASTVCMLREGPDHVDYLVLCDSTLVLDQGRRLAVVTDHRFRQVISQVHRKAAAGPGATPGGVMAVTVEKWEYTNQPNGYWIAAADPQAAYNAVVGTAPLIGADRVRRAALLTDGASAAVDQFGLLDWNGLIDVLTTAGPAQLIHQVRAAEYAAHLDNDRPRYKRHDDATAGICLFEGNDQ
jgi:hypothetical protein